MVCNNCGEELDAGQTFCPFCGNSQGLERTQDTRTQTATETSTALQHIGNSEGLSPATAGNLERAQTASFSSFEKSKDEADTTRRKMFIIIALASAVLVAGLIWLATRPRVQNADPRLEGAIRPGSTEFAQFADRLILEFDADQNAVTSERAIGDVVITMLPTVRNFTGRTINGLELRAVGFDLSKQIIKERHFIVIPSRQPTLETNRTMMPSLTFEGIKKDNVPASLKVEITGVKFK